MSSNSKNTTDPNVVRKWVEARNGKPARVKSTASDDPDKAGLLRIDFPGYSGEESLEPIDWETFTRTFESQNLAFIYEEATSSGEKSRFCKFVSKSSVNS